MQLELKPPFHLWKQCFSLMRPETLWTFLGIVMYIAPSAVAIPYHPSICKMGPGHLRYVVYCLHSIYLDSFCRVTQRNVKSSLFFCVLCVLHGTFEYVWLLHGIFVRVTVMAATGQRDMFTSGRKEQMWYIEEIFGGQWSAVLTHITREREMTRESGKQRQGDCERANAWSQ